MYQIFDENNLQINLLSDQDDEIESMSLYDGYTQMIPEEKLNEAMTEMKFEPYDVEMLNKKYEDPLKINQFEDSQDLKQSFYDQNKLSKKKIGKELGKRKIVYFVYLWRKRRMQRGNKGKTQDF